MEAMETQKKRSRQRRDETIDRRQDERRRTERRWGSRRAAERRKEFCPVCSEPLTPLLFCRSCKMKVIKIRD
ncbi:MAG TPA: hypothetical protein VI382_06505 [Candidatus Manganitrophaceae bacterium]|nr:hypothetical protein [Candidatus Manganitrophaceae bacterium]